jgi:hypothetical protein
MYCDCIKEGVIKLCTPPIKMSILHMFYCTVLRLQSQRKIMANALLHNHLRYFFHIKNCIHFEKLSLCLAISFLRGKKLLLTLFIYKQQKLVLMFNLWKAILWSFFLVFRLVVMRVTIMWLLNKNWILFWQ